MSILRPIALGALMSVSSIALAEPAVTPIKGSTGTRLVESLKGYEFPITSDSPEAQAWFNQGIILAYGFNHGAAIRAFQEAAAADPSAAMAWWGIAYANGMHLNVPEMSEDQWRASREAAVRALVELDDETPMERALVNAVSARTAWPPPAEQRPFDEAYASAMTRAYADFGEHPDVAVLYAESLMNLQPWDYWDSDLSPKGRILEVVDALEATIKAFPTHPQAAHLYIHAMEAGPNPGAAVVVADMLRDTAPAAGHLVHMPSHIYARVGRYGDAVTTNEAALRADADFFALGTPPGTYYIYHAHNVHFLCFAAMMEGRYDDAIAAARRLEEAVPSEVLDQLAFLIEGIIPSTQHALIRFGKWEQILQEPAPSASRPLQTAIYHYARGIAFAATGKTKEAKTEIDRFEQWAGQVPQDWWVFSNKAHDVLPIARHMLHGELAYREGDLETAWMELSRAIELEDKLVYDEPPGWMIPVRHAMGALLLEAGEHQRAEALYREDQIDHPGNGWSLLGLAQALEAQGKDAEASVYREKLDAAWARVEERPTSSCLCAPGKG